MPPKVQKTVAALDSHQNNSVCFKNHLTQLLSLVADRKDMDYKELFDKLAQFLTQQVAMHIAGKYYCRLAEIEFYYTVETGGHTHKDPFSHCHPFQLTSGEWYFHRINKNLSSNYKGGTYKGLDISIGDKSRGIYGGVLLRSLLLLDQSGWKLIEGPCLLVDFILKKNGASSIEELVSNHLKNVLNVDENASVLCLKLRSELSKELQVKLFPNDNRYSILYDSPRVGLTLRNKEKLQDRKLFIMKFYRYTIAPKELKKCKNLMICAQFYKDYLSKDKKSKEIDVVKKELAKVFGISEKIIETYIQDFKKGEKIQIDKFVGKKITKASDLCQLAGACLLGMK